MIQKSKITWENVKSYCQGKIRYKLFYSKWFRYWIRLHIFEQINYRVLTMDKECLSTGSCKMCGCETTALQMADKACDKPCYPEMMTRDVWEAFKVREHFYFIYSNRRRREFELKIIKTKRM